MKIIEQLVGRNSELSQHILTPYSRYPLSFAVCERPIAFDQIFNKTATEFISIAHVQSSESVLFVHAELSFVVVPSVRIIQIKILVVSCLISVGDDFIIKYPKPMERVINPTT